MLKNFANLLKIKCMKKYYLLAAVIFSSAVSFKAQQARVGINTDAPKSTLDIRGKTANADGSGTVLNTDMTGFQAPRLTRLELTNKGNTLYGADQTGALIYITDISTGDALSQRVNITAVGYYYFDGSAWVRVGSGSGGASGTEPWFIQNTTDEATSNSENIYQTGKVAIGQGFDGAVTDKQFEVAGGYKMEKKDALGTSLYGTMTTDAAKSVTNYSITPTHTSYSSILPTHILNTLGETGVSLVYSQMYDDGHFDFYGRNSTTDSNWEMYGKVGADGEDHLRFKHRQASGSGNNRWSSEIFLNKTTGNSFKFNTNTGVQGNYTFPRTNGTAGQVLMTDGVAAATGAQLYWGTLPAAANDWHITGNAGTTAGTNFIGTTDNVNMVFKRSNVVSGSLRLDNTSFGVGSLPLTATGNNNTAIGTNTLASNTTGNNNVAIGSSTLAVNTIGANNVGIGPDALRNNTSGATNIVIGGSALRFNTSGEANVAVGPAVLNSNTVGSNNTAMGWASLGLTTGSNNTAVGKSSGYNITTGSNNTAIGYDTTVPDPIASNQVRIGNTAVTYAGIQVAWTVTSDKRLKSNIKDSDLGLDFIKQLRPVSYIRKNDESKKSEYGFIAQELKETLKNNGVTNSGIISEADDSTMSVRYNDLLAPLVKAVQEQQKLIEDQQAIIMKLQKKVDELGKK